MSTTSEKSGISDSLVFCAILLAAVYGLVNFDKLLTGWSKLGSTTKTISWRSGTDETALEMYWSNGHAHYLARFKVSQKNLFSPRAFTPSHKGSMTFSLRNRFGAELCRLDVAATRFQRENAAAESYVATGSFSIAEADFLEACRSSSRCRNWHTFGP